MLGVGIPLLRGLDAIYLFTWLVRAANAAAEDIDSELGCF